MLKYYLPLLFFLPMGGAFLIYALARIFFNQIFMWLGVLFILGGVLFALAQEDIRRLLAGHSVSQIGYVMLGMGLATPMGIMGGLFHLLNQAIFMPLLFLNAGAIEYACGTRELKELGGLRAKMPVTANTSLIASLSISGIPPFNGFWSKLFIIVACIQAGRGGLALAAVLGGIFTLASFLKVQEYAFFRELPARLEKVKEIPWWIGAAMVVFALLCFLAGVLFPAVVALLINPAVKALTKGAGSL